MVAASETGAAKIEPAISKSENDVKAIETPMIIDTVEKKTEVSKAEVAVAPEKMDVDAEQTKKIANGEKLAEESKVVGDNDNKTMILPSRK